MRGRGWWLFALVLLLWLALMAWPLRLAGMPPDLWLAGSDERGLVQWMAGLSSEALAALRGPWLWLDSGLSLALVLWLGYAMRPYLGLFGGVCLTVLLAALALDLTENWTLQRLLWIGPERVVAADAEVLSRLTQGKFLAYGLALALALRQSARRAGGEVA